MIEFICWGCNEGWSFKQLKTDMLGKYVCPECNCRQFEMKRGSVSKATFKKRDGEDNIIGIEKRKKKVYNYTR